MSTYEVSTTARNEIALPGCNPTPLASYLKALGVLRLVAEQGGDPDVRGRWRDDVFVLLTTLSADDLMRFFLDRYSPTPLVAPWNGGSGFYPKDNVEAINALAASTAGRFRAYRTAVALARSVVDAFGLTESPKNEVKQSFLQRLRNGASERLLGWMDAAVILAETDPRYPPLLGTGGNDGRLDFTNNFMQRLTDLFETTTGAGKPTSSALLRAALFLRATDGLPDKAIGQFAPGHAGGPNASAGFEGTAKVNPWDFVFMLEGAVVLAASAARRLDTSGTAAMSAPFTVRSRSGTVGAAAQADDSDARGEIWMPLWANWWSFEEVAALFAEGRAVLGARHVRDGLDFARAAAKLGVDRGLGAFQRYGFLMRAGKAFLATPLSRVAVRRNPQADLIDELERRDWLTRVQRHARDDTAPSSFRALAGQLDAALFTLTQRSDRDAVQRVLRLVGRMEALCSTSTKSREALVPLPSLSASWAVQSDDGSAEFGIARALAGLAFSAGSVNGRAVTLGLRPHLAPITLDGRDWHPESRLVCWGPGPLERNLAAMLHRRRLAAVAHGQDGEVLTGSTGAQLAEMMAFIEGRTDDRRIAELAAGLACVLRLPPRPAAMVGGTPPVPPAYAWLKPLFTSESMLRRLGWLPEDRSLRLPAEVSARLAAGDVPVALRLAWQRLRALDKPLPGREPPSASSPTGLRLLAALLIPLAFREQEALLKGLSAPSNNGEPTSASTESTIH